MKRIGRIVGWHGLRGHLKVAPLTDFLERFHAGRRIWIRGSEHEILASSEHKGQVRIEIEGVHTPEEAEALRWEYLLVPDGDRPRLEEGEYLVEDLIGLQVIGTDGRQHGTVEEIVPGVVHDLARVGEMLVPLAKQFVKSVNLQRREMLVELVYGMADDEQAEEVR